MQPTVKRSIVDRLSKRQKIHQHGKDLHRSDEDLDLGGLLRSRAALLASMLPAQNSVWLWHGCWRALRHLRRMSCRDLGLRSTSSIVAVELLYTMLAIVSAKIWGVSQDVDPANLRPILARSQSSLTACTPSP